MRLYRYFKEESHAEAFNAGRVAFGLLCQYRCKEHEAGIGAARHDEAEGQVLVDISGAISTKHFYQPARLFCCSTELSDRLKCCFGSYVFCINDSEEFAVMLTNEVNRYVGALGAMQHGLVNYADTPISKREYEPMRSQFFSKPESFSYQSEYRYGFYEREPLSSKLGKLAALCAQSHLELDVSGEDFDRLVNRLY